MLLEKTKFLEEAISTMYEEVMEELESIKEGANPENAHIAIAKIVQDLYDASKNFESLELDEEKELEENELEENECSKLIPFQFSITAIVDVLEPIYVDLSENEEEVVPPSSELNFDKSTVVVERKLAYGYEPIYTVEQDGKKFMVSESFLLPADNDAYEFSIGDEVIAVNPGYTYGSYKPFASLHGYPDAIGDAYGIDGCDYQPEEGETGIVIARGKHLKEDIEIDVVQIGDRKYLMENTALEKK